MTTCSIVVSMYNAKSELIEMIEKLFFPSLLRNASAGKQFILLDDASPLRKETQRLVEKFAPEFEARFGDFQYCCNSRNLGFAGSYNRGIRRAEGQHVIIINDDVYLPVGSIDSLVGALNGERIGLVGPITNYAASFQSTHLFRRIKDYSPEELRRIEDFAQELKKKVGRLLIPVETLIGFCLGISKDLVREIGYLDESFTYGIGEDTDYCIRAQKAGYRLLLDASTFVEHGGPRGGSMSFLQHPLKTAKYKFRNFFRLVKKHKIPYRRIVIETFEPLLQFFFDKRTVTAQLKPYINAKLG